MRRAGFFMVSSSRDRHTERLKTLTENGVLMFGVWMAKIGN
jgi:hypothetical protein